MYAKVHLNEWNWKRIVLAGLLVGMKMLMDCAVFNEDFLSFSPEFDIKSINALEREFLKHIEFNLMVTASLYSSYYFALNSMVMPSNACEEETVSLLLQGMDLEYLEIEKNKLLAFEEFSRMAF
eukprot:TRINITY_DN5974_c0_g1_i1.p1 TRINITY_DN5974_c0_g1~~TRINITY_DN5974_c0_g1_i1.p1  ORF type:complete len:145 (-),score=38.55 TRINITY_DN5974_c0_g1_i1:41-412(-)